MLIHRLATPFTWPARDLPLTAIERDWSGARVDPPPRFAVATDDDRLWLVAARDAPPVPAPHAVPGTFTSDLWWHDVAELFIGRADSDAYAELNLAPNGAWWACAFTAPRVRRHADDVVPDGVLSHAEPTPLGGWRAALGVPHGVVETILGTVRPERANVTFVLAGSSPRYCTAAPAPGGAPDFHLADLRVPVRVVPA